MNQISFSPRTMISCTLFLLILTGTRAQDSTKQQKQAARQLRLKTNIEGKQFTFVAQTATPQSGRLIQLTSLYTLKIMGDSVIADLPYFGQTYMGGGYGSGSNGIQFASSNVSYQAVPSKNGWNITITPKGNAKVQKMFLNVGSNGYGTLRVSSATRSMISFYGVAQ